MVGNERSNCTTVVSRWQFRPSFLVTVAAVAFVALTVSLGLWQTRRGDEKEALQNRLDRFASAPPVTLPGEVLPDPQSAALRRVAVRGEYDDRHTILLDNRVHRGRVGYHVISPLRIAGSDVYVLVNRGWVAAGRTRSELPRVDVPSGQQTVEGIATVPTTRFLELSSTVAEGSVWQNLALDRYRSWSKLTLQPVVIEQTSDMADGLVREWSRPDTGVERHRSYALQWFSLAALTLILYVVLNLRRNHGDERRDD